MNLIIMPYLDCADLTRAAAGDCLQQTVPDPILLLIDNGSQAEARSLGDSLHQLHPQQILTWHHDPPYPSLAGCWNRALQCCWEAGGTAALVVNNDVRLAPWTYELLLEVQQTSDAWFVSAVSVTEAQFEAYRDAGIDHARRALGTPTASRKDGIRPEGYSYGGPDFSCYLITREGHRWFQFDEAFVPAYHEDNDYHRRLQLAGFGDRIFGVNLPFFHVGSATINRTPRIAESWQARFAACQRYYIDKWGGVPGQETFHYPFEAPSAGLNATRDYLYTGQGRPGYTCAPEDAQALFDARQSPQTSQS